MRCRTYEKRISDDLDGRLSGKRKQALGHHLAACGSCRAYRDFQVRIQAGTGDLQPADRDPLFWTEFNRRLEIRISGHPRAGGSRSGFRFLGRNWGWAVAGFALLIAVGIFVLRPGPSAGGETVVLAHEESLSRLFGSIGSDARLEQAFHRHVVAALDEAADDDRSGPAPQLRDDPFFWESLSDEELEYIEQELQKENRHGGSR